MSREQYTPPNLSQQANSAGAGGSSAGNNFNGVSSTTNTNNNGAGFGTFNITGSSLEDTSKPVHYLCGDCDAKVVLRAKDPIRCKECGYRVLYKERTNRMIQFEAR